MKNMAVRGTIIMLAAVALIGAVVALRVAQAQTRTYEISVTPDKILEGNRATITVKVTVSQASNQDETVYLHIATTKTATPGATSSLTARCTNPATAGNGGDRDFDALLTTSVTIAADTKTITDSSSSNITPIQDVMIEGDEKISWHCAP